MPDAARGGHQARECYPAHDLLATLPRSSRRGKWPRERKIGEAAAQGLPYYLTAGANRKENLMNIHATHEKLAAKGAPFDFPPIEMPGGTQALFRDPDGNGLVLSQRR